MAKVLVIGASRGIGKAVAKRLAEDGHSVRAFSRSGHTPNTRDTAIEAFRGDALSAEDIKRALQGVETVIQALGVKADFKMITGPVTLFSEATRALLPAMGESGVKRLIAVTGFGAGDSDQAISPLQRLPFCAALGRAYDDKSIQETLITRSALDWMIVRPGVLTDGPPTGTYRVLTEPATWRNGVISRADVADFIADQVDTEPLGGRKPVLIRWPFPL
ncbi:MAG: SDR family NAD(P)-dependent oxidoreductase [Pseudomonadota bacterium]